MRKILALLILGLLLIPMLSGEVSSSPALQVEVESSMLKGLALAFLAYIDTPSILMLLGFIVGGALLSCPLQNLWGAVVALFTGSLDAHEGGRASAVFRQLAGLSIGSGVLSFVVMSIPLLNNMDDPNTIGPGTSTALYPLLYSSLLGSLFFYSLASDVDARSERSEPARPSPVRRQS